MHADLQARGNHGPLIAAGVLLGMGLGGFLDGILFHQVFQLHNMLSAVRPKTTVVNIEINMFWDGLFHLFTWALTALGLGMLWKVVRRADVPLSTQAFTGSLVLGWGLFNVVEGVLDHMVLHLHHVVERLGLSVYDYAYVGSGVLFILLGWTLIHGATHRTQDAEVGLPSRERGPVG